MRYLFSTDGPLMHLFLLEPAVRVSIRLDIILSASQISLLLIWAPLFVSSGYATCLARMHIASVGH